MIISNDYSTSNQTTNSTKKTQENGDNSFEQNLNKEDTKESRSSEDLVKDIISLLKIGFTIEELEQFQEYIRKLKEEIKKEAKKDSPNYDEIEKTISQIEKAIAAMKKSVTGQAIIKVGDDAAFEAKTSNNSSDKMESLLNRLEVAQKDIESFKAGRIKKEGLNLNNQDEFKLLEELKYFNRINN